MSRRSRPLALACAAALLLCSACSTRLGDLTVASSKNIPTEFDEIASNVEGEDCVVIFLGIPIGTMNPTVDGAIDDALEGYPTADALSDLSIHASNWTVILFGQSCVTVKGDAISTR